MKTIVNKIRIALLLGFMAISMTVWSQIPNVEKMSISTQMFLDELAGKCNWDRPETPSLRSGEVPIVDPDIPHHGRHIASPDTIDGKVYVSAYIRVSNPDDLNLVEALGVIIECRFEKGMLVTSLIPVDKILDVAAIEGVENIEVATIMEVDTDNARQTTNADDVLTLSDDALALGIDKRYDGSGVILGIIDTGIDFNHKAFQDKNGNTRIVGLYCNTNSNSASASPSYNWTGSGTIPTTDNSEKDHGSHTSAIAGGSNVIVSGTNVTVTDDPSQATYGGMAPGADLYLAGLNKLYTTRISNVMRLMADYADTQNKPLVISNSYGSTSGPHDGGSSSGYTSAVNEIFGNDVPNRIALFSSGNEAGDGDAIQGGGKHVYGTASSSNPLRTILRCHTSSSHDDGYAYTGDIASIWCRSTSVTSLGCKILVLDTQTGNVLKSITTDLSSDEPVSGLGSYYSGSLKAYSSRSYDKVHIVITVSDDMTTTSSTTSSGYQTSNYTLAMEVYPTSGSAVIDGWAQDYSYFSDYLTTNGYTWTDGTDDMTANDFANNPNIICVGSYVSRQRSSGNSLGDISKFSSYATPEANLMGIQLPWITAPGEVVISASNHYFSASSSNIVVNNSTSPYVLKSGTSMACPAAAGIVALWFQAAKEVGKNLTLSDVKEVMKETAIRDSWVTSGANASHFGNGKINALAGIQYILGATGYPIITATPTEVTINGRPGVTNTATITVRGFSLTDDIIATLNDNTGTFSISSSSNLGNGGILVITYSPTAEGNHTATITLSSTGAADVTITLNGISTLQTEATICDEGDTNQYLPVYGYYYDEEQSNQMLYPYSKFTGKGMDGNKITKITFYPTTSSSYSGINFYYSSSYGNGTVTVKLANMPSGTSGYASSATRKDANFVTVKTIKMPSSAQTGLTEWVFEDLENDFIYEGGDLLIEVTTEAGRWGRTYFAGENQTNYMGYYNCSSYPMTGLQFLPKVTFEWESIIPVTTGTVSPDVLSFGDVGIGRTNVHTVTITNTGNQTFTPVIDTSNLPEGFTVSGNGQVLPDGTLNLTVTYAPTSEGQQSGSFTITIGDQTYTVTVSGNGFVINNLLTSNEVTIPAYHSDIQAEDADTYIFTEDQVILDIDMNLEYPESDNSSDVEILVKSDEPITSYDLKNRDGEDGTWTLVGNVQHQGDSYVFGETTMTFLDGETEMWFPMDDNTVKTEAVTYYVPVTIADGVITEGNTYGAPIMSKANEDVNLSVIISGSKSDKRLGGHWTHLPDSVEYCVYTTIVDITCNDLDGVKLKPYLYRAWVVTTGDHPIYNFTRNENNAIVGTNELEMPYLLGEIGIGDGEYGQHVVIGQEWDPNSGVVKMQNAFGAPCYGAQISVVVRAYYQSGSNQSTLRGNRDGGMYGFAESGGDEQFDLPTGVMEIAIVKEIVDVTYVNPMGMVSQKPFNGVNIVVTRYSDGTTSTAKIIK